MDRSRRTKGCMDCTIPVLRRSSAPFLPDRFHLTLAFHSPPFFHDLPNTRLTTGQNVGPALCPRDGRGRAHAPATSPDAASG
jgi:hypothetical protein